MAKDKPRPIDRTITIELVPTESLLLDPENPRLASSGISTTPSQQDLAKFLWSEMSVDELVLSIAANGYFREEPLFAIPASSQKEDSKYYVVEGNRRLAAVKILLDDSLRQKLRITNMPVLSSSEKTLLRNLPVSIYKTRKELWTYLSFRHINAPMEWDAYSKAKYIAQVHDNYGVDLAEIAQRIGDQHQTVQRMYEGYKTLRQAEESGVFNPEQRYEKQFYFSHWYTAIAYGQFQKFLGIKTPKDLEKKKPIPQSHTKQLGELLTWIYGNKNENIQPKVIRQNPDLNMLREIITNPSSLSAIRSGLSLKTSHEISMGDEQRFRESLTRAKEELQRAKGTVTTGYQGDDNMYQTMKDVEKIGLSVREDMDRIRSTQ